MTTLTANELRIQLAAARAEEAQRQAEASAPARRIAELEAQAAQAAKVEAAQRLIYAADDTRRMADDIKASAAPVYDTLTAVHDVLKGINPDAILSGLIRQLEQHAATVNRIKNDIGDEEWTIGRREHLAENMAIYNGNQGMAELRCDEDSKRRAQQRIVALNLPETPSLNAILDTWVNASPIEAERQQRSATLQKVLPSLFGRYSGAQNVASPLGIYPNAIHANPGPMVQAQNTDGFWKP